MNDYYVHPTSIIDQPCKIGSNTKIWHFCHIMKDAVIGEGCTIGQNVFIASKAIIGNRVKIQNNVSVFEGVVCEDGVFLGPSVVFTNVKSPRSYIEKKDQFENTLVKTGASIGANATVICGNEIGKYAFVGAGSVVTKDVKDFALVFGNPAKQSGWICVCGSKLNFNKQKALCENCRKIFLKNRNKIEEID